jgi:hypothetical protein
MISEGNGLTIKSNEGNKNIKAKLSGEIVSKTDEYLLNGGKIQVVEGFVSTYKYENKYHKESQAAFEFKKEKTGKKTGV